jgi:hypothetical protein
MPYHGGSGWFSSMNIRCWEKHVINLQELREVCVTCNWTYFTLVIHPPTQPPIQPSNHPFTQIPPTVFFPSQFLSSKFSILYILEIKALLWRIPRYHWQAVIVYRKLSILRCQQFCQFSSFKHQFYVMMGSTQIDTVSSTCFMYHTVFKLYRYDVSVLELHVQVCWCIFF